MTARAVFVTGTDTGVGKTVVACALVRALVLSGARVTVMKPVASGAVRTPQGLRNADALALIEASQVPLPYSLVNPYCFEPPLSPHIAAREATIEVDTGLIAENMATLAGQSDWVVIEGAGGWFAPISERQTMADLACTLGIPCLLVVGLKLGCLNHAQLARLAIALRGASFAGWIASAVDPRMARLEENLATLSRLLGEAPLEVLGHERECERLVLSRAAARLARELR